jgi:hypothetical protein
MVVHACIPELTILRRKNSEFEVNPGLYSKTLPQTTERGKREESKKGEEF